MITVSTIPLTQNRITLLATYNYQIQNNEFVEVVKKSKQNLIDNPTISKGISQFIKDNKLDSDRLFIEKGIFTVLTKDLIEITSVQYNNTHYITQYEIVEKVTDKKYEGVSATPYQTGLNQYKRFKSENEVDFEIVNIHEMGYAVSLESVQGSFSKYSDGYSLSFNDYTITDDRNQIISELKDYLGHKMKESLPDYLLYKGNQVYATKYDVALRDYMADFLENNTFYSRTNRDVELRDEMIYFDDQSVVELVTIEFMLNQLSKKIIPIRDIENKIKLVMSIPGISSNIQINEINLMDRLQREIMKNSQATRNFYFAKDILEQQSKVLQGTKHLINREVKLKDMLVEMMQITPTTHKVYVVSQYLLMNYFSSNQQSQNDKKNLVIDELIKVSREYSFELIFVANTVKNCNEFSIIKGDFKGIHGRYIIVVDEGRVRTIKLDGELEHFDDSLYPTVTYKDLTYIYLKNNSILPNNIKKIVGELK